MLDAHAIPLCQERCLGVEVLDVPSVVAQHKFLRVRLVVCAYHWLEFDVKHLVKSECPKGPRNNARVALLHCTTQLIAGCDLQYLNEREAAAEVIDETHWHGSHTSGFLELIGLVHDGMCPVVDRAETCSIWVIEVRL